jgi:hypothetical protein
MADKSEGLQRTQTRSLPRLGPALACLDLIRNRASINRVDPLSLSDKVARARVTAIPAFSRSPPSSQRFLGQWFPPCPRHLHGSTMVRAVLFTLRPEATDVDVRRRGAHPRREEYWRSAHRGHHLDVHEVDQGFALCWHLSRRVCIRAGRHECVSYSEHFCMQY